MEDYYLLNWVSAVHCNSMLNDGLWMQFISITIFKLFSTLLIAYFSSFSVLVFLTSPLSAKMTLIVKGVSHSDLLKFLTFLWMTLRNSSHF